jgi:uncharacterized cupin superfamily protein
VPVHLLKAEYVNDKAPPGAIRWDRAWELFNPDHPGDVEKPVGRWITMMAGWAWSALGQRLGRTGSRRGEVVTFVVPNLTPAGEEFVVRVASFWTDEVVYVDGAGTASGPNLWTPPVANIHRTEAAGALGQAMTEEDGGDRVVSLFGILGFGRMRATLETIAPGHATARLHSHSSVDEYYLVVAGRATLRFGAHDLPVGAGDLIGKPTGPDLSSHIMANLGQPITVLDMEVWPDARLDAKDVVHYPDFGELYFRGPGWWDVAPDRSLGSARDLRENYDRGYERGRGGDWTPKDIPGTPPRERKR